MYISKTWFGFGSQPIDHCNRRPHFGREGSLSDFLSFNPPVFESSDTSVTSLVHLYYLLKRFVGSFWI